MNYDYSGWATAGPRIPPDRAPPPSQSLQTTSTVYTPGSAANPVTVTPASETASVKQRDDTEHDVQTCDVCDHRGDAYRNHYGANERNRHDAEQEGWKKCAERLKTHDDVIVRAWKEEIDALLVFAGLFSAVLTAFNVELYTALKPDPGVDLTNQILLQISAQLNGSPFQSAGISLQTADPPSSSAVWINAFWFSALVSSLSAASIAIIIRQWLNHFISPTASDSQQAAQIHCLRFNVGLIPWHVPEILSFLPILLLLSLNLFFVGLLILLWGLNNIVAAITTGLVSALFAFFAFTTITPAIRHDCPYKSPQALSTLWLIYRIRSLLHYLISTYRRFARTVDNISQQLPPPFSTFSATAGGTANPASTSGSELLPTHSVIYNSWRALELAILHETASVNEQLRSSVARGVLAGADATLSDDLFLTEVVNPCALGPSFPLNNTWATIHAIQRDVTVADPHSRRGFLSLLFACYGRMAAIEYTERWFSTSLQSLKKLDISGYILSSDDARAAFVALANLYPKLDGDASTAVVRTLAQLMPKLREPFIDDSLTLDHNSVVRLLKHASQELDSRSAKYDVYPTYTCSVALVICASAPIGCYQRSYESMAWDLVNKFFSNVALKRHDFRILQAWGSLWAVFALLLRKHTRPRIQQELVDSLRQFIEAPDRRCRSDVYQVAGEELFFRILEARINSQRHSRELRQLGAELRRIFGETLTSEGLLLTTAQPSTGS